jgi:hypothetical protein
MEQQALQAVDGAADGQHFLAGHLAYLAGAVSTNAPRSAMSSSTEKDEERERRSPRA